MTTFINRSNRHFQCADAFEKDGKLVRYLDADTGAPVAKDVKVIKRSFKPGDHIVPLDAIEEKILSSFKTELYDVEKEVKPVADKIAALTAANSELANQVNELKDKLQAYETTKGAKKK